jgi:uncharacterized protein
MVGDVLTDATVINDILDQAEIIYLALCDEDGPHCVPVNFGRGDGCIYIHSGIKGRKIKALRMDGRVSFSTCVDLKLENADQACNHGYYFKSVVGAGKALILEDDTERKQALKAIINKYTNGDPAVDEKTMRCTVVVKIELHSITARVNLPA